MSPQPADEVTIGVVVTVPEPFAEELTAARASFGDPAAQGVPPHITVLEPTVMPSGELDAMADKIAAAVADVPSFVIHLRSAGTFRPATPVVFVQVASGIVECERFARAVRDVVPAPPSRFRYHPHVTVAHGVDDDVLTVAFERMSHYEATFVVNSLDLYTMADDGTWHVRDRFPLAAAAHPGVWSDDEVVGGTLLVDPPKD